MNTPSRLPGRNVSAKIASLSQQSGQNGIILPRMYFYFRSMRFIFVSKVTRFDKATIFANDTTLQRQFVFVYRNLSHSTGIKFLMWTNDEIRPGNRVSPVNRNHMKRPWDGKLVPRRIHIRRVFCLWRVPARDGFLSLIWIRPLFLLLIPLYSPRVASHSCWALRELLHLPYRQREIFRINKSI